MLGYIKVNPNKILMPKMPKNAKIYMNANVEKRILLEIAIGIIKGLAPFIKAMV